MIRLNYTPLEGSTVKVNLGFKDSAGRYYIPVSLCYSLLALNNNKASWSIVDDTYKIPLTPASNVVLTLPDLKMVEGTTSQRKVMVYWTAFVDGEYNEFVDEINFDVTPKPYVQDEPVNPPVPPIPVYVEINDVSLQVGSLSASPVNPVFILKTNLPVNIDNATALIDLRPCTIKVDSTGSILTVYPETVLDYLKSYTLKVSGLVSTINGYVMKDDFSCNFVTENEDAPHEPIIEDKTEAEITENGIHTIEPSDGYDATRKVEVTVDVNPPLQSKIANENGTVTPDDEFYGLSEVVVAIPLENTHIETIRTSGETTITPSDDAIAMKVAKVNVIPDQDKEVNVSVNGDTVVKADTGRLLNEVLIHTAVPQHVMQNTKTVNISTNTTSPIIVNPDEGYDCLKRVEINVNVPAANVSLYAYTGANTGLTFYSIKEITGSGTYKMIPKNDGGSFVDFADYEVSVTTLISFEYEGNLETLTRDSGSDVRR